MMVGKLNCWQCSRDQKTINTWEFSSTNVMYTMIWIKMYFVYIVCLLLTDFIAVYLVYVSNGDRLENKMKMLETNIPTATTHALFPVLCVTTVIFWGYLRCWHKSCWNKVTLFLAWRYRYWNSMDVIMNWLTVPKYQFLMGMGLLRLFFFPRSPTRLVPGLTMNTTADAL